MLTVAVFGNCQAPPLGHLLRAMSSKIAVVALAPVHLIKPSDVDDVYKKLAQCDVVVHQPTGASFGAMASDRLRERFEGKHWLSFASLYFNGYFPHLMYLRKPGGGTLAGVINEYHDERVILAYLRGASVDETVGELASGDAEGGLQAMSAALADLHQREAQLDIRCASYIEARCRAEKLFYVMNHPTNGVLVHAAGEVLKLLELRSDRPAETVAKPLLDNSEVPVESAVLNAIPTLRSVAGAYRARSAGCERRYDLGDFVAASFAVYRSVPDFGGLVRHAQERRKRLG